MGEAAAEAEFAAVMLDWTAARLRGSLPALPTLSRFALATTAAAPWSSRHRVLNLRPEHTLRALVTTSPELPPLTARHAVPGRRGRCCEALEELPPVGRNATAGAEETEKPGYGTGA